MAVVKKIPDSFADEKKLRDALTQCGAVQAVRTIAYCDGIESAQNPSYMLTVISGCVRNADCPGKSGRR